MTNGTPPADDIVAGRLKGHFRILSCFQEAASVLSLNLIKDNRKR